MVKYLAILRVVFELGLEPVQRSYPEKIHLAVNGFANGILKSKIQ